MSDAEKHSIRNQVIAGLIVMVIGWIVVWLLGLMPKARRLISAIAAYLGHPVALPAWVLGLMGLGCLGVVAWMVAAVFRQSGPGEPNFLDYTQDEFFGVEWNWSYRSGRISNLLARCPRDGMQMIPSNEQYRGMPQLVCEACGHRTEPFEDLRGAVQTVERHIERKVRSGEFRAVLQRYAERQSGQR